jgi:hypothetical protein
MSACQEPRVDAEPHGGSPAVTASAEGDGGRVLALRPDRSQRPTLVTGSGPGFPTLNLVQNL